MERAVKQYSPDPGRKHSAFGTFLETATPSDATSQSAVLPEIRIPSLGSAEGLGNYPDEIIATRQQPAAEPAAPANATTRLLTFLAQHGPTPVGEVLQNVGIGVLEFGSILPALIETRMAEVVSGPGGEQLAITPVGERFIALP